MAGELSRPCFDDECDECAWADCKCDCHYWQTWDFLNGWVDDDEEATDG